MILKKDFINTICQDRTLRALTLMPELRPTRKSKGFRGGTATDPNRMQMTRDAYLASISQVYGRTEHAEMNRINCALGKYDRIHSISSVIIALR